MRVFPSSFRIGGWRLDALRLEAWREVHGAPGTMVHGTIGGTSTIYLLATSLKPSLCPPLRQNSSPNLYAPGICL
jgi:hypothetical protein